ncbi:MAG TPA: amidohydrolase family protein [Pirellulales bacterium]|nr:amidohydrolase family protein [Pirellulales bacterium]
MILPPSNQPHNSLSRREVLRTAAGSLAAAAIGVERANSQQPMEGRAPSPASVAPQTAGKANLADPKTGAIDAHVHVWTPDAERYPLAPGFRRDEMKPPSFTPEQLFEHARPCGVARIVLIQMSFYGFNNSYMLDSMRRFPGVFSGVAVINDSAEAPQNEMRRLAKLGVRGFRIYPRNKPVDRWLDGPGMQALWKCGGEEGLAMCNLVNPEALPAIARMGEKFPDTPIVIDHFARIGVGGAGLGEKNWREAELEQLCRLAKNPRAHVKLSAFYALGKKQAPYLDLVPMIRRLLDAYGPQRLMWATDCPYQVQAGHNYADSIALVRDRLDFLSAADRDWLLRRTAEKVFFS